MRRGAEEAKGVGEGEGVREEEERKRRRRRRTREKERICEGMKCEGSGRRSSWKG